MADTIMQIIQWAIPSGGLGAAIGWLANRNARRASAAKSVHDTYKLMYEDISRELIATQRKVDETARELQAARLQMDESARRQQNIQQETQQKINEITHTMEKTGVENTRLRYAVNRLTRAIQAIDVCPHRDACPVSLQLSDDNAGDAAAEARGRQRRHPADGAGPHDGGLAPAGTA